MDLPLPSYEQGFEDTQSVENDIDTLYQKFIVPIDQLRSISEAPSGFLQANQKKDILNSLKVDNTRPLESRASAFYRMLGFPVVDRNGNFYNPGFSPYRTSEEKKDKINTNIDATDLQLMQSRETVFRAMRDIFSKQDTAATIWSLVMGLQPKKFNNLDKPEQTFKQTDRSDELAQIKKDNPTLVSAIAAASSQLSSTLVGADFDGGTHLLLPFTVDPAVDFSVMPSDNKVCVPFLKDQSETKLSASPDVFLLRPGIEYILRARLSDNIPNKTFLADLENILTQQKKPSQTPTASADSLFSTIVALAEQNNINDVDLNEVFGNFSSTQIKVVRQLIRAIKNVIEQLHESVSQLDQIRSKTNFLPLPSVNGPEQGGVVLETTAKTELDTKILQLTIKKLNAERDISIQADLGKFATPFINLERTNSYDQQLQELNNLKKTLGKEGLDHLRKIEIITGEVSGLGLIDVLAVYTALWSIDIRALLGLLDTESFNRLYENNSDLRTQEVVSGDKKVVQTALEELEVRVGNILSFADKMFSLTLSSPQESIRGEP
jgi:hypothetical protein